jgi:POT family proton-dependent oligopeptide transporter
MVPVLGDITVLPSQIQSINPILILFFAPLFTWVIYPALAQRGWLSARGKVASGMVLAGVAFAIVGRAQTFVAIGAQPSVLWQLGAYVVLTVAEVVVSITTLELAYASAPKARRSLVTSFYLLSVSLGNGLTALFVGPLSLYVGNPSSPQYFYLFGGLSLLSAIPVWVLLTRIQRALTR